MAWRACRHRSQTAAAAPLFCAGSRLGTGRRPLPPLPPLQNICGSSPAFCAVTACRSGPCLPPPRGPAAPPKSPPASPVPSPAQATPSPSPNPVKPSTGMEPPFPSFPAELGNATTQYSWLWGKAGELWTPASRLADWSYAGYMGAPLSKACACRSWPAPRLDGSQGGGRAGQHLLAATWCPGASSAVAAAQPPPPLPAALPLLCAAGEAPIPGPKQFPVRFNVKDPKYGARGDGVTGEGHCLDRALAAALAAPTAMR